MLSLSGITISKVQISDRNDHKLLTKYLNGKNVNNKVNRWGLELATYNITFEWISGSKNIAADSLTPSGTTSDNISTNQHAISLRYRWTCFQYKKPNSAAPYTRYFHSTTKYYNRSLTSMQRDI